MRTRAPALALALALAALAALAFGATGCGGGGAQAERTVPLRLSGGPADATVTVDDQIVGSLALVAARGVALPPGKHRITVEARGFLPFDKMVEAEAGPVRLDVSLVPVPD